MPAGLALRYGGLYGPGNVIGKGGELLTMVQDGKLPLVGGGAGVWSFCHVDDAASATAIAVDARRAGRLQHRRRRPGPGLGMAARARPNHRGEAAPARAGAGWPAPLIGEHGVSLMTKIRGSSNAKAKRELGWELRYPSWREGFRTGLG